MTTPVGDGAQSGATGTQSGTEEVNGTGSGTATDGTGTAQSGGESTNANQDTVSRSELDQVLNRMKAADQRASKAELELKQIRDKDLPEAEKLKRDFADSQAQVEKLTAANNKLALEVAFLKDNTYAWHNPESALRLVDLSQVEIAEDGTVRGLKDALKALATSNDYLIKKEVKQDTTTAPAGTAPGNNGTSGNAKPSAKGLAARIPALNTRVPRN